jgi:hypothetical protein
MPNYAPELVANVLHAYQHTDKPIAQIAADHHINERDVTRIRHAAGCPPRGQRVRALPPAMRELQELTMQLTAEAPAAAPAEMARAEIVSAESRPFSNGSAIERTQRLVEQELAALEATRASLGSLARAPTDAERCARILSILSQTLHRLMRMQAGAAPEQERTDDDDLPADIDERRNELARRIDAFVASRTHGRDGGGAPGAAIAPR